MNNNFKITNAYKTEITIINICRKLKKTIFIVLLAVAGIELATAIIVDLSKKRK